jgi:hypothetical protein
MGDIHPQHALFITQQGRFIVHALTPYHGADQQVALGCQNLMDAAVYVRPLLREDHTVQAVSVQNQI